MNDQRQEGQQMSQAIETQQDSQQISAEILTEVLVNQNIEKLSSQQRLDYLQSLCKSVGLNPLTRPFQLIKIDNKLTPYATRDATDQLRRIHGVSITNLKGQHLEGGVYQVEALARDKNGRTEISTGVVTVGNLKGDALANALMKAETKAKRRVTLSICGLGFLDESETDTIPAHVVQHVDQDTGEIIEAEAPALPEGMQKASEINPNRITRPQLAKIYATAKEAGYESKDELDAFATMKFGHRTSQLTKQEASLFIEMLIQIQAEQTVEAEVVEGTPDIEALWNQAVAAKAPGIEGEDLSGWLYGHFGVGHPSELTPKQVKDAADKLRMILESPF